MEDDQKLFTKVTGVTKNFEEIEAGFKEAYGDEADSKLKARIKAWVGEGKAFDFNIDEKYPLSKAQELLDAAEVGYNLSEADVEEGSTDDSGSSYDPKDDGSDDEQGSSND